MRRSTGTIALTAVGCAVVLAGCGSSGHAGNGSAPDAGVKFAACMRSHGVPNFPDPSGGGGIQIPVGSGINPGSPSFQSAQKSCSKLLSGGGPRRAAASEQQKLKLLAMSRCMRQHGFSTFPDPTASAPRPGAGGGLAFGAPGAFIAIPMSIMQSPGFSQAAGACGLPGAGPGPPAKRSPAP